MIVMTRRQYRNAQVQCKNSQQYNSIMRSQKSPSCYDRPTSLSSKKYYSVEQVMQIIKSTVSQKLNKLYHELQQNQYTIKILNDKLNENDQKLEEQARIIEQTRTKGKQANVEATLYMINKIVNDKIQQQWIRVKNVIQESKKHLQRSIQQHNQEIQYKMQQEILSLKTNTNAIIDTFKKKNNSYWLKVKETLNKINAKVQSLQDKNNKIILYARKVEEQRKQTLKIQKSLQKGQKTARAYEELERSIRNVYDNYQQMLSIQQKFKNQYQHNYSLSLICQQNRKGRCDPDVILQYSKEEETNSIVYKETDLTEDYNPLHRKDNDTLSPLKTSKSLGKRGRLTSQQKEQTSLCSFNNDLYMHSRTINLSMDSRKQMSQNIRQRLIQMIGVKKLNLPLRVCVDKANNLKNHEGYLMFDLQGTMFKVNPQIFRELQRQGIIESLRAHY